MTKFKKGDTPQGAKPFAKGKSGNPKGYPKGVPNRSTVLRKVLAMQVTIKDPFTQQEREMSVTVEEAVILGLTAKAISGDVAAVREILDTVYGTNKAQVDVTTNGNDLPATQLYLPDNGRG
ncbi:MAG: DUF5681 domain-containing protein [Janthinobacterium lividum]